MTDQAQAPPRSRWFSHLWTAGALLMAVGAAWVAPGCSSHPGPGNGIGNGSSSGGDADGGGCVVGADGRCVVGADGGVVACTGSPVLASKRLVRLTFNQIVNSIGALLPTPADKNGGSAIQTQLTTQYQIIDAQHRTFPPLSSAREGSVILGAVYTQDDLIARDTGLFVFNNFGAVTNCATATDACAQAWLKTFAQSAFRRPLTDAEIPPMMQVYLDDLNAGGSVQEATQYGVYAILSAPQFLYRTEFGTDATMAGSLTPYELASAISYFLTDSPPDAQLMSAAGAGMMASPAQVRAQAGRIAGSAGAQANLEAAMFSYFQIPTIETVVIDTNKFPAWNPGLQNSMRHETELFLHNTLWKGTVTDLLTAKQSNMNKLLADFYGISPFPQAGSTPDNMGFALTNLPDNRSGIVTQSGFLVARANPDKPSIVKRGLLFNAAFLCGDNPPFPSDPNVVAQVNMQLANTGGLTDRQLSDFRRDPKNICSGCHGGFDPYGVALGHYDLLASFQANDPQGRPIDSMITLPNGTMVTGGVDMAKALTTGGTFLSCMTKNILAYALAEPVTGGSLDSCSTANVATATTAGGGNFTTLVTEIAASQTLAARSPGGM